VSLAALASRLYPAALTRELGLAPVRGMLLYGPPGCGKTLLAREITRALGARDPKIVNGPEMMSKYVGDSEQYIRALFADAELEQSEQGDASALHVIVFDEMDAFTRERGSLAGDTSGIRDSVVNQLLAKMDGVDALNNVLVIGLTNRPELMDPALLRPGRLEVQVQVPRPDHTGRQQILNIHTQRLRQRRCLDERAAAALASGALARVTHSFSGAELAGLVRSAASFALERYVDSALLNGWAPGAAKAPKAPYAADASPEAADGAALEISFDDLVRALREATPTPHSRASAGKGRWSAERRKLLGWWREAQLKRLTSEATKGSKL
jgi:vesicle-fusing ATPase